MNRKVINVRTLQIWNSLTECAEDLGVKISYISASIPVKRKIKGERLEYLDCWVDWTRKEKEEFTKYRNIYFL